MKMQKSKFMQGFDFNIWISFAFVLKWKQTFFTIGCSSREESLKLKNISERYQITEFQKKN